MRTQPSLLEPNYADHYGTWARNPSPETLSPLLTSVNPILHEALRSYGGTSANSPTLRSKAKLMAIDAIKAYDPTRAKLRTHLLVRLQGLRRLAAREEQPVRIPEQTLLDRHRMNNTFEELKNKLGRDPSDNELARQAGLSLKRIGHLRSLHPAYAEGSVSQPDEEGQFHLPAVSREPSDKMTEAWLRYVHADLDPTDQIILEHTTGMNNKKVLQNQELARKLRLSPGAVSQRKLKIQQKLSMLPATGLSEE